MVVGAVCVLGSVGCSHPNRNASVPPTPAASASVGPLSSPCPSCDTGSGPYVVRGTNGANGGPGENGVAGGNGANGNGGPGGAGGNAGNGGVGGSGGVNVSP